MHKQRADIFVLSAKHYGYADLANACCLAANLTRAERPIDLNEELPMTRKFLIAALIATAATAMPAFTISAMSVTESGTVVDGAVKSADHTTLVAAVTAAGLVDTLNSAGPFTVFAPTNAAFSKLPAGTVETLLKPENKATLTKILTYHVVSGKVTAADVLGLIAAGNGSAKITTVSGGTLTASLIDGKVTLTDEKGGMAHVIAADVMQTNGIIHVTDAVSLPN